MKDLQNNLNQFVTQKFLSYGLHLGSLKLKWNPKFKPFLTAFRHQLCLINLDYTLYYLKRTLKFLFRAIIADKQILFIGSPMGLEKEFAVLCKKNNHYFLERGLYGFFSDYKDKYYKGNGSASKINKLPVLIVLFDPIPNYMVIEELKSLDLPLVTFVNSDEDYSLIDYPVPANIKSQKGGLFVYNLFYHLFKMNKIKRKKTRLKKKKI